MANLLEDLKDRDKPQASSLPVTAFQAMDHRDEDQILAEMRGEILKDMVYSYKLGEETVTNLSYAGVKEAIRRRGHFEILEVRTEETPEEIRALVKIRDKENNIEVLGASSAEKSKPFAYTLAVNKAERNAFAKLIPVKWYATLIDEYLKQMQTGPVVIDVEAAPVQRTEDEAYAVPITVQTMELAGLTQTLLVHNGATVGMLNVLEEREASVVPVKPIPIDLPPIKSFLIPRVFKAIALKEEDFHYRLERDEKGLLRAILVRGKLDKHRVSELASASKWAFARILETKAPVQGGR